MGNYHVLNPAKSIDIIKLCEQCCSTGLDSGRLFTISELCIAVAPQITPDCFQVAGPNHQDIVKELRRLLPELKAQGKNMRISWDRGRGKRVTVNGREKEAADLDANVMKVQSELFRQCVSTAGGGIDYVDERSFGKNFVYPHLGLWLRCEDDCFVTWRGKLISALDPFGGKLTNPDVAAISSTADYLVVVDYKDTADNWEQEITNCASYKRFAHEAHACFPLLKDERLVELQEKYGAWQQWEITRRMASMARAAGVGLVFLEHKLFPRSAWEEWAVILTEEAVAEGWMNLRRDRAFPVRARGGERGRWYEICTVHTVVTSPINTVLQSDVSGYCSAREWFSGIIAD